MFERGNIRAPEDFFAELKEREGKAVWFCRINAYSSQTQEFLLRYYGEARRRGAVIEGKLASPDAGQLAYFSEMMGMDFRLSGDFFAPRLKQWLPRMRDSQRENVAAGLFSCLSALRSAGKNENMLKNAYVRFMCWMYYRFEGMVNRLGEEQLPKILYEGTVSFYELLLLSVLSRAGADVILLQYQGDAGYRNADPGLEYSEELVFPGAGAFPEGFCIKQLRREQEERLARERLYGEAPARTACTNAWRQKGEPADVLTEAESRGSDPGFFYNCFEQRNGVWDRQLYVSDLYQLYLELKKRGRTPVVAEGIPQPSPEELNAVRRRNYAGRDDMLRELSAAISCPADQQLERIMKRAFLDILLEESESPSMNENRLTNRAVYLLCWLKRYQAGLFSGGVLYGCFICFGGCKSGAEALFLRFLARLPVDVLILCPERGKQDRSGETVVPADPLLYEVSYEETLSVRHFPTEESGVAIGTAAYQAERDLDAVLYRDTGLYRTRQHAKASVIALQTMYEEIALLWGEEVKYRPNFGVVEDTVHIPVIFAKISGVKDGDSGAYWAGIRALLTEETFLVKQSPLIAPGEPNPLKAYAVSFLRNGKVQKQKIREHPAYRYGFLREEMQEYILDKLQLLIDRRMVRGMSENGMEYTAVATVLNLRKEILRLIQNFDFTGKNPKLIYISTSENMISPEDAILTSFLHLAGFDVLFFVPTGYQSVEQYYNGLCPEEHQAGGYQYDLCVPDLKALPPKRERRSWRDIIFKRG